MSWFNIIIPGPPVPKGRPRLSTIHGRARAFTPARTQRYEDLIRLEAGRAMEGRDQIDGALSAVVRVFVAIPASMPKRRRADAEAGLVRPVTRPDLDNYIKCLDALNGIVFRDDSQIAEIIASKRYSTEPRLEIELRAMS